MYFYFFFLMVKVYQVSLILQLHNDPFKGMHIAHQTLKQ